MDPRGQFPISTFGQKGLKTDAVSTVDRSKLEIRLPRQTLRLYLAACFGAGLFGWPNPSCEPIAERNGWTLPPLFNFFNGQAADAWVQSPPGAPLEYGTFPPVRVHTVAFGNIPVEATAHISQTVTDGIVDPLAYQWLLSSAGVPLGTIMPGYEEFGPSSPGKVEWAFPAVIEGPVRIRLSDVRVDGVPVKVGPSCRTSPTTLALRNPPGWFNKSDQVNGKIPAGEPGAFFATGAESEGVATIGGTIDIPPFRGCGVGGEGLDPLVTALVSGRDNPVQATVASAGIKSWCDAGLKVAGDCLHEDWDDWPWPIDPDPSVRAARQSGSVDLLARIPQRVRDKMSPGERREIRRFLRASY